MNGNLTRKYLNNRTNTGVLSIREFNMYLIK